MKWYQSVVLFLNSLVALYFLYTALMQLFVYFANRSMGYQESFLIPGRTIVLALLLSMCSFGAWYALRQLQMQRVASILLYFPLLVVVLFALWTIILLLGSGGKWN